MNLRAGSAGAGLAHLPEVVFFIQPEDAVLRYTGNLLPEFLSFIVFAKNGDVQLVFGQLVDFRDQLPGKADGIGLKVIAEGEVTQHFEESVVAPRIAHVFKIVMLAARANAFLRAGGALVIALFLP